MRAWGTSHGLHHQKHALCRFVAFMCSTSTSFFRCVFCLHVHGQRKVGCRWLVSYCTLNRRCMLFPLLSSEPQRLRPQPTFLPVARLATPLSSSIRCSELWIIRLICSHGKSGKAEPKRPASTPKFGRPHFKNSIISRFESQRLPQLLEKDRRGAMFSCFNGWWWCCGDRGIL